MSSDRSLADALALAREQSRTTPGRYVALGVATRSTVLGAGAFLDGEALADVPRSSIASLTKPVTAAAVMQLAESGAVDLDAPIRSVIGELDAEPTLDAARITARHILSHTSGLHDVSDAELRDLPPTPGAMLAAVCRQRLRFTPGTAFQYASEPWFLLSALIERASGRRYPVFLSERLFEPLGMTATSFDPTDAHHRSLPPQGSFALPGLSSQEIAARLRSLEMPGGGLWSTPHDLLRFARAMLRDGELDGARVLEPESLAAMTELHTDGLTDAGSGAPVAYGLGWGLRPGFGASDRAFAHAGATGCLLVVDPVRDLAVVYLRNWWGAPMDDAVDAMEAIFSAL
ncbi:MAG TPA: serine hydrolase domain-containing protein [Candidatus Limnocylindria bacterium]|nr:serine hydrolase domain-containing protein [Candidatus Limnocylindria bacterium]